MAATPSHAQTEFAIKADSANLKAEYQKELDKWMLRAYGGDRDAQFKVGVLFANDQFGAPDLEQSSYWYTQAARQGHVLAQYNLGHLYLTGNGVKRNEKTAMQWWIKAAEQQHALAQFNVGRAYYLGIGLGKDLSLAKLWFERASQNNEPKSIEILKQLGWWDEGAVATVSQPVPSTTDQSEEVIELPNENILAATLNEDDAQTPNDIKLVNKSPTVSDSTSTTGSKPSLITIAKSEHKSAEQQGSGWEVESAKPTANTREQVEEKATIAVFTDPAIRSVLITILDNSEDLKVISEDDKWSIVESAKGLPAWVSKNFIRLDGARGTVTGNSVNARSVPLIASGSIVGRLNKGESITILDERGDWYRIRSPQRFRGWVKSSELLLSAPDAQQQLTRQAAKKDPISRAASTGMLPELPSKPNDNSWLFAQNKEHYTLQLASFNDPNLLARYVNTLPFKESQDLKLFTSKNDKGIDWIYVLYGSYSDAVSAKGARQSLNQKRAWVRRIGVLQQKRCLGWKKELPAPKELNEFCI